MVGKGVNNKFPANIVKGFEEIKLNQSTWRVGHVIIGYIFAGDGHKVSDGFAIDKSWLFRTYQRECTGFESVFQDLSDQFERGFEETNRPEVWQTVGFEHLRDKDNFGKVGSSNVGGIMIEFYKCINDILFDYLPEFLVEQGTETIRPRCFSIIHLVQSCQDLLLLEGIDKIKEGLGYSSF